MSVVRAKLAQGRSIGTDSFADLTPKKVASIGWDGDGRLVVQFADDLTPDEAQAVTCRIISTSASAESVRKQLATIINATDPTTTAARLVRLETLVEALARLLLGED